MNKQKGIPELRFPDFVHKGEWELRKLGESEVSIIVNEKVPISRLSVDSYISTENILSDFSGITKASKLPQSENLTRFTKNDILVSNIRPYLKKVWKAEFNGAASNDVIVFRVGSEVEKGFLEFLLKNEAFIHYVMKSAKGVKMPRGDKSSMQEYPVMIPPRAEQQKIAACLSTLDELITAHEEKLQTLKDHKKGLMQNLFPQEGEKVPRYRFKEFEKDGDWVEKKLEGLAKRGSGHTPNKKMPNYYNGGIKWVSLADSNKLDNGYIYATTIEISKEGIENSSAVLHPPGTVILSRDAGVGKSAILYSEMAVSQHFIAWVCDESQLSNWYLYYVLQTLKSMFENIAVGNTIKTIGLPYFKELHIPIPTTIEQQKIASCLSSLDELITSQSEKIEQLKLHKKGLMQGLFPHVND